MGDSAPDSSSASTPAALPGFAGESISDLSIGYSRHVAGRMENISDDAHGGLCVGRCQIVADDWSALLSVE